MIRMVLLSMGVSVSVASAAVYTDKSAFLANVQPGAYEEGFAGVLAGFVQELEFGPTNGFSYKLTAVEGLFNDDGLVSPNSDLDALEITFTGAPVTAVGGNFWATNEFFGTVPANVKIELSNGTVEEFFSNWSGDFRGFTSSVPISKITIDAGGNADLVWSTMDNLIVGVSTGTTCYPDCDGSEGLDIDDFICFQTFFALGDPYADCDESGGLDIDDFICFQTFFAIGC